MIDSDSRIWGEMLAHLRRHHPALCRQWFEQLEPLAVVGGVLPLRAQSGVHRDYLQRQCLDPFNDAVRAVTQRLLSVRFLGPEDDAGPPRRPDREGLSTPIAPVGAHANGSPARRSDALVINPDCTFEHFVIGPNNRLAHAAALAVADNPGRAYNPIFIHGGVGLGKTHLLQAICLRILERAPAAAVHYISCDGFMTRFFESVQAGQMAEFRHRFRDVDVLVIDDIHFLAKRDQTQEEFFHTFNSLYHANKQIVLSSDAAPEEIPHLEERLVSRFKWGLVTQIQPAGFETRVEILKRKAALRGLELPDPVAEYIASRIESNIRELEGAVTKIQIQAMVEHRPVDMALAQAAIGDPAARAGSAPTIHTVISAVTSFYGVRLTDLQSKRRHRSVTLPRQVCMYLAREHTRHSLEEIGGHFGGRDHTTVMHAVRMVEARRKADTEFDAVVASIDERLRRGPQAASS